MRVSTRLTTNAGASATSTPRLRSFLTTSHAVASCSSVVCGVRTISTSGSTATGLKKWSPTSAPISSTESDDVFVARIASGATRRTSREDLALHVELLEHRLEHEVAAGELLPAGAAVDERGEERLSRTDLLADRRERGVDARLIDVAQHDRHLEPADEQRRELRRHQPGADDADLLHLPRRHVGQAGALLRPPLDDGERVRGRLRLRADEQLPHRRLLGGVALLDRQLLRGCDQLERDVRRPRRAVHRVLDARARLAHDRVELRPVGLGALDAAGLDELDRVRERLVDELDGLEQPVGEAELDRLGRGEQLVLAQRVGHDQLHRRLRPGQPRSELRAAPGGDDREEDLGEAEVADARRDRARVAVQRELEPAAEAGAVDRRHGRETGARGSARTARARRAFPRAPPRPSASS